MRKQKIVKTPEQQCNSHIRKAVKLALDGKPEKLAKICVGMRRAVMIARWSCAGKLTAWSTGVQKHYEGLLSHLEPILKKAGGEKLYNLYLSTMTEGEQ